MHSAFRVRNPRRWPVFALGSLIFGIGAAAARADECGKMEVWDAGMAMCMPRPMAGMPMRMLMLRGQAFGVYASGSGPRGRDAFAAPNMIMADLGASVGANHYLNLDFMGTAEKWTFPSRGYPEPLQIGEEDASGAPFIDAQHPHSSPIMGLTLSDTIALDSEETTLKLSFAPRGESVDGPIAFMHRATGEVNPDAPLGHHLGQDAGHISSTVIAASLASGPNRIEASAFHGAEPHPTKVDLPLGTPDSYALRLAREFEPGLTGMISAAYVKNPEHDDPATPFVARYSGSVYSKHSFIDWTLENAFILGMITKYDGISTLFSATEEFLFRDAGPNAVFGRVEFIQRSAAELGVSGANEPRAVFAATAGYLRALAKSESYELGFGGSVTHAFLPGEFRPAYDGDPWAARVFLRLSGSGMWEF